MKTDINSPADDDAAASVAHANTVLSDVDDLAGITVVGMSPGRQAFRRYLQHKGAVISTIALFIIVNTIRLAVVARREEIEVMRLVGASDAFIRWPFIFEGAFVGLLGAGAALAILAVASGPMTDFMYGFFRVLPLELGSLQRDVIVLVLGTGLGVGILAPWVAVAELGSGALVSLPLGKHKLKRQWGIGHLRGRRVHERWGHECRRWQPLHRGQLRPGNRRGACGRCRGHFMLGRQRLQRPRDL